MKKFAFLSDIFFAFFVCFIFTLCLFRYLRVPLYAALLLACLCGILTALSVGAVLRYRRKTVFLKRSDEAEKQKLLFHLALLSDERKTELFQTALYADGATQAKRFGRLRLYTPTEFYFLKFPFAAVTADEIANLSRLKTNKKKILLCAQIEDAAYSLCERLNIEVRTGEWVYAYLKSVDALPTSYLGDAAARKNKRRYKLWFAKANAKRFLLCSALILLLSRLTPFYYYYLLLGGILLLVAVFVRIFGYE